MTTYTIRVGIVGLLFSTLAINAHAEETVVQKQLRLFNANPKNFMLNQESVQKYEQHYKIKKDSKTGETISEKLISQTAIPGGQENKFLQKDIDNGTYISKKNFRHEGIGKKGEAVESWRTSLLEKGRSEIDETVDSAATLVEDGLKLTTLDQMESFEGKSYKSSSLKESPWSGDYWAIYAGVISKRYNDPTYMTLARDTQDWLKLKEYIEKQDVFAAVNSSSLELLSPAEKYDFLIGDKNMTLTKAMMKEGEEYYDKDATPKVATWMGICHGWAPAAYMEMRPRHDIELMAADGKTKITFHPSDIKALASLLWAQAKTPSNFVGTRCNVKDKDLDIDPANGRIKDQSCFDTNPGTWHKAVVNQLGYHKKSFVLDATFDYEVWNQPAYAYEYSYFNPATGKEVDSLEKATVAVSKTIKGTDGKDHATFDGDKFSEYRSEKTKFMVGIAMKFTYIAETAPSTTGKDVQDYDRRVAVNYLYDLELDAAKKIIGGEWYHKQHPDFLWSPPANTKALSRGDTVLSEPGHEDNSEWRKRHANPVPANWIKAAIAESSPAGQPLARIVKDLLQKSNQVDFWFFGTRHWNKKGTGMEQRYLKKQ